MREEDGTREPDSGPEEIFRALRDRPTPELEPGAAWARLQARLEEPPRGLGARLRDLIGAGPSPAWRWAPVGLAALVIVAGWWALAPTAPVEMPVAAAPDADLVLLADADDTAGDLPPTGAADTAVRPAQLRLDARLIRGFDGATPSDAMPIESLGAGGADPLADLTPTLSGILSAPDYALIGRWEGSVDPASGDPASTEATVSPRHRLTYRIERTPTGLRLLDVRLLGEGAPLIADAIDLEPGRLYVFGAGGADTDLVLALRLTAIEAEPGSEASADPAEQAPRQE